MHEMDLDAIFVKSLSTVNQSSDAFTTETLNIFITSHCTMFRRMYDILFHLLDFDSVEKVIQTFHFMFSTRSKASIVDRLIRRVFFPNGNVAHGQKCSKWPVNKL